MTTQDDSPKPTPDAEGLIKPPRSQADVLNALHMRTIISLDKALTAANERLATARREARREALLQAAERAEAWGGCDIANAIRALASQEETAQKETPDV